MLILLACGILLLWSTLTLGQMKKRVVLYNVPGRDVPHSVVYYITGQELFEEEGNTSTVLNIDISSLSDGDHHLFEEGSAQTIKFVIGI